MKKIELTGFDLEYDGVYFIKWGEQRLRVYLSLDIILKMLDFEGLTNVQVIDTTRSLKPLHFNKTTLIVGGEDDENGILSAVTSGFSDYYSHHQKNVMFNIDLKGDPWVHGS